jgi:hypothetical protein
VCKHPKSNLINAALTSGQHHEVIGERFGFTRSHISKHFNRHVKPKMPRTEQPPPRAYSVAVAAPRITEATMSPATEPTVTVKRVRTPDAVLDEIEWVLAKSKATFEEAERMGDWRLANTAMTQVQNAVDKLAKAASVYSDATIVNVDNRTQRAAAFYDTLPTEVLRRLSAGEITLEALVDATTEAVS